MICDMQSSQYTTALVKSDFLALLVPRGVVTPGAPQPLCGVFCRLRGSAPVGRKDGLASPLAAASGLVRCSRGRALLGPAPPPHGGLTIPARGARVYSVEAASPDRTDHAEAPACRGKWRYSRGREIGITRSHDDRDPGVSDVTPDFWVRVAGKKEDGQPQVSRESDAAILQMAKPTERASEDEEESKRSAGTADGSRTKGGTENPEPSEETLNSCHVHGGVWLKKMLQGLVHLLSHHDRYSIQSQRLTVEEQPRDAPNTQLTAPGTGSPVQPSYRLSASLHNAPPKLKTNLKLHDLAKFW
ncbi:hypothetical protein NDU88_004498 [Pleurodeles waltl]|uniref:Uncharacterized protein n=1 Tax=Pleurodeles waltl TaxID=8319 RepID=A0AAV7PFD4_PLEWA|nr:hypothetical protein NDU88_004498 [Pleurodeles waltl]